MSKKFRGAPDFGRVSVLAFALGLAAAWAPQDAGAQDVCARTVTAKVVTFDQPLVYNRLGAQNVNGIVYALRRDVVDKTTGLPEAGGGTLSPGNVAFRPDKRPRPLVLRVNAGDCLQVHFQNLLAPNANPFNAADPNLQINNQVAGRFAGFQPLGLQLVTSIADDASFVGQNANNLADVGQTRTYTFFAESEGGHLVVNDGAAFGGEASGGNTGVGMFAQVNVEPEGADYFRSQVTEEEMDLATTGTTASGHPIVDYDAVYPNAEPWISEGKAGLPVLRLTTGVGASGEIVHADLNAIVAHRAADGSLGDFPPSTYPLESQGLRNPTVPNRLEPFREFTVIFHDENAVAQAFPGWFEDPVLNHTLHSVRDSFLINYGSGGIGAEIIANRLGVGPMHDCLTCAYEEFFLSSWTVGDPAMLVDVPANVGLEACDPAFNNCEATGPKASVAFYPDDPSNVHHSYTNDFVKFRNTHAGPKEQHVFHLHNHQWLFDANDDNSNYLDAQGIGPGAAYTYEINFGGSGNRNKTAGDAIFHCHFYPHFAQGMWELWRVHDTFEKGTELAVSGGDFHATPFALQDGTPAVGARALPDGEIVAGTPIPAVVPLPGKPMAPLPGRVEVVAKDADGDGIPDSSQANIVDRNLNPGFPFWIAGIEETVGQRPTTPPLDMLTADEAPALGFDPIQAGGTDGGLPRHTLDGYLAGGQSLDTQNRLDFSKLVTVGKPVYFPEAGTDIEKVAMAFHAQRFHDTFRPDGTPANGMDGFVLNGASATPGAPYNEPCIDDQGDLFLTGQQGDFFDGQGGLGTTGVPEFGADAPRIYKAAVIQLDVVFNKVGYHYPQQRIITLNEDVAPTLAKTRPPEPFVIRMNTFDCANFLHTNLVPKDYELDDYQVRTPTDVIGQHIHLPKWDLTAADGAANGWNYEDGTFSPGMVVERIEAINAFNDIHNPGTPHLEPEVHPFFGAGPDNRWVGARTTIQRWFADPVVNVAGEDRGLGIIFTHDHFGPSTHQQIGLYGTLLIEPARSDWVHNETGEPLYTRDDGGPTTWQAAILDGDDSHREFFFEYGDFQHAYEKGVFVGVDEQGNHVPPTADTFRNAINPSFRQQAGPVFPDIMRFPPVCPGGVPRPCPEAISADDVGMLVVNYRNEPVGLRVFDPNKLGPDGKPGTQADGKAGDLGYALDTRADRAIAALNTKLGDTPYPALNFDLDNGDPFTPMMRTLAGDIVRVKFAAGAHEHEHNVSVHGIKWLQGGSGFGVSPNSGWRNSQNGGISEQFTLTAPVIADFKQRGNTADYAYSMDNSQDGWWSGTWGLMRTYDKERTDLVTLQSNPDPASISNKSEFDGVCPKTAPVRSYDVSAVLANDVLPNDLGVTIVPTDSSATQHEGGPLDSNGGTLVYNPRFTNLSNGKSGPLHDPTAVLYVRTADLDANGKLKPGVPVEPLTLRAAAGECIEVTLRNNLPEVMPDLAGYNTLLQVVNRDRNDPQGLTTFQNNLVRPSSEVGLHPQLVEFDITRADGVNVGTNPKQTVSPGESKTVKWYAGDVSVEPDLDHPGKGRRRVNLVATPVELGGANLTPADKVKQGQKALVGALVVEPEGATWTEDTDQRTAATVTAAGGGFRDFAVVHQKGLNHRYKDGAPVENIASEGQGIPEDSHDAGQMAINYGTEPLWFRFGLKADAPFGNTPGGFGAVGNVHEAFSNVLAGGDPVTPVFTADAGEAIRFRVLEPTGVGRGTTFALHGHQWQRAPYQEATVASQSIGFNPNSMYVPAQESVTPQAHFDVVMPSAGGALQVPGDYLFRDQASFGVTNGLWGILRVAGQ